MVDDDDSILSFLHTLFTEAGMEVTTATSAEQALESFTLHEFDVVVTDIQMGGMSGFELLKRIKLIDRSMKVIVMTSYNSYESVLQALQLDAYDSVSYTHLTLPTICSV